MVTDARESDGGAAAVEFALLAVPLVSLIFAIVEFGVAANRDSQVVVVASAAARRFAAAPSTQSASQIQTDVRGFVVDALGSSPKAVTVTFAVGGTSGSAARCPVTESAPPDSVSVTVSAVYPTMTRMFGMNTTAGSTAVMTCG